MCIPAKRPQTGMTLIELVMFIVIVSVGLAGVLSSLNISVKSSADPLLAKQALAIAEGLLEEIQRKNYTDPDGTNSGETRATWDNVTDFDVVDGSDPDTNATLIATDLLGNSYVAAGYTPKVLVTTWTLDTTPGTSGQTAYRITVTVSYAGGSVSLTGYRTNY